MKFKLCNIWHLKTFKKIFHLITVQFAIHFLQHFLAAIQYLFPHLQKNILNTLYIFSFSRNIRHRSNITKKSSKYIKGTWNFWIPEEKLQCKSNPMAYFIFPSCSKYLQHSKIQRKLKWPTKQLSKGALKRKRKKNGKRKKKGRI